ncbi:type IV secretory system conjugative DNA transfer family protein [Paenibacillus macquariensis]|uniref:TraM recognition site of TraD and TraG n=1 Tax=Paenibacillus macquariensis TaxID=948756 RepID=A0ABY1KD98_9BACL|nr:TraG/TraD/VirD4 family protein [Paenibacillus macquariensis]MEC0093846.1 TraG/TraD/VirD4 family protein [Paenibacillus macquariensis]OAB26859.1 hypothetical protein PMSM_25845 [Paenibacillus macquariensis subsp. macquariensis]SIR64590.1 TraM recognition site of TraD and TraG [Paenibacillus macquariensis]
MGLGVSQEASSEFISELLPLPYVGFDAVYENTKHEAGIFLRVHLQDGASFRMVYYTKANGFTAGAFGTEKLKLLITSQREQIKASAIRSRNISVSVILQNMTQLKGLYKDSRETIIGNCDTILFLGGQERSTLEWVNKRLGKQTFDTKNSSQSRGRNSSSSINYGIQGRDLMTIDEIAQMLDNKCILFIRGMPPFYSEKFKLELHPNYKLLYEANDANYFDSNMGVKHAVEQIAEDVNMRVPDQDREDRKEELILVNVEQLDDIEKRMNALI